MHSCSRRIFVHFRWLALSLKQVWLKLKTYLIARKMFLSSNFRLSYFPWKTFCALTKKLPDFLLFRVFNYLRFEAQILLAVQNWSFLRKYKSKPLLDDDQTVRTENQQPLAQRENHKLMHISSSSTNARRSLSPLYQKLALRLVV